MSPRTIALVLLALILAGLQLGCGEVQCPEKAGATSCGYCDEDRLLSDNPHAGMCTYCAGTCGPDACNPVCGGGGSSCDTSWVQRCGTTAGGIQFVGAPHPKSCGSCPKGTYDDGDDNVTAGGPYNICACNGF